MKIPFNVFTSSSELERHQRGKAYVHLLSSLSDDTHDKLDSKLAELGIIDHVTTYKEGDIPSGRSVHQAADSAGYAVGQSIETLPEALSDQSEVVSVMTPDGTGMIGVETLQPFSPEPLDAVTRLLTVSPNPTERERVCRAFNLATLGRSNVQNVFISKDSHDETPKYPEALAEIEITLLFIDTLNLFSPGVTHETIPPRDVATTRQTITATIQNLRKELGHQPKDLLGFNSADWLAPGDTFDQTKLWSDNPYRAYVVVPEEYEQTRLTENLVSDEGVRVTAYSAPVDEVRILLTRELSDEFVSQVKVSGITWLYENASSIDAWVKEVNSECSYNTDIQAEVADFLTDTLNVYDPEVLQALRERGADV